MCACGRVGACGGGEVEGGGGGVQVEGVFVSVWVSFSAFLFYFLLNRM